jgi:hypothetical protein
MNGNAVNVERNVARMMHVSRMAYVRSVMPNPPEPFVLFVRLFTAMRKTFICIMVLWLARLVMTSWKRLERLKRLLSLRRESRKFVSEIEFSAKAKLKVIQMM